MLGIANRQRQRGINGNNVRARCQSFGDDFLVRLKQLCFYEVARQQGPSGRSNGAAGKVYPNDLWQMPVVRRSLQKFRHYLCLLPSF